MPAVSVQANPAADYLEPAMFRPAWLYWLSCRPAADLLPGRQHLDPVHMPPGTLPHTLLVDVLNRGERLRFRLIGSQLVQQAGRNLTGRFYDEAYVSQTLLEYVSGLYRTVVHQRCALYTENIAVPGWADQPRLVRRLMMPLANNGVDVDMVYCIQDYTPPMDHPTSDVTELRRVTL